MRSLVIPYPIDSEQFDSLIVDATIRGAEIEFVYGEAADKLNDFVWLTDDTISRGSWCNTSDLQIKPTEFISAAGTPPVTGRTRA